MTDRRAAPAAHAGLGLVLVLGGLNLFAPLSVDMYLPALPQLTRDLAAPASAGAMTVAAFYVGMCLGQLVHGPISDRIGRRKPLLAGIALYVAASAGAAAAPSIGLLILFRFLMAVGGCAGLVISRAAVRDRFPPQESAHVFSTLLLVMSLGPIVAPMIGSGILLVAGWRAIFWVLAGFGALVGIATFLRLAESRSTEAASHARGETAAQSYLALLREPQVMAYALAGGASHAGLLTYLAVAPDVLIGRGVSPQGFAWVVGVNGIGLITANILNRRLLARHHYDTILRRANLCSLTAAAILMIDAATGFGGLAGLLVPLFAIVTAIGFTQPNAFAGALAHDPARSGAASALVGCIQFGIGAIGASLAGLLHDGTARPMAAVILAVYVIAFLSLRMVKPAR